MSSGHKNHIVNQSLFSSERSLFAYVKCQLILAGDVHINPGPNVKLCVLNVRSLFAGLNINRTFLDQYSKLDDIKASIIDTEAPTILALTETWLNDEIANNDLIIPGYNGYRKDRNRHGGGLLVYIKEELPSYRRIDLEPQTNEALVIQCKIGNKNVVISNWYRPPNQDANAIECFLNEFCDVSNSLSAEGHDVLLSCGDFNDRCTAWDEDHITSELHNRFRDCLTAQGLYQVVNECTRVTETSSSILDLIITDSPILVKHTYCLSELNNMDHKPVISNLSLFHSTNTTHSRTFWHYSNGDFWALNKDLNETDWESIFNNQLHIDEIVNFMNRTLLDLAHMYIPQRTIHYRSKDKAWMTPKIRKCIRLRNRWCARYKRTKLEEHKNTRNLYRKLVKTEIQKAKQMHTKSIIESLSDPRINAKRYWTVLKEIYSGKLDRGIPTLVDNNAHYVTDYDKANLLCDHFSVQCSLPPDPPDFRLPPFVYKTEARLETIAFEEDAVKRTLSKLNISKANGPDNISNRLLKECSASLAKPACNLFNACMEQGYYPAPWKRANSSPVFKKDDKHNKNNYRPISLLPCLSKVFERLIYIEMYEFCIENNLLTERNSGFKELDSTVNQLVHIVHSIYQGLDTHKNVCSVFLDISKAFDKVYHRGLLFKLKQIGISGKLFKLLESYLSDRYHRVVINGVCSDWKPVQSGVPQGSILGPLLFLIFINDIVDDIKSNIYIFADDTSLMQYIDPHNVNISFATINEDLHRLHEWSIQWRADFNALKSSYIIFTKCLNRPLYPPIMMGNSQISEVDHHKHLGVVLDSKLDWTKHIDYIVKKASKRVESMRRVCRIVPRKSLVNLYKCLVRPICMCGLRQYRQYESTNDKRCPSTSCYSLYRWF